VTVTFIDDVSDGLTCPETITRTYQAEDACGNTSTCEQTIVIDDTTDPGITCPADLTFQCVAEVPAADINLVTASDNCGTVTVTFIDDVSDGLTCPETITRTYQAEDACGNTSTCEQTIVIDATTDPGITCPADLTFQCVAEVQASDIKLVSASYYCGTVTVTFIDDVSDGLTCPETITRTYQAEDACGNTSTCEQTIVIDDTTDPGITCPADLTFQCVAEVPAADINLVTASDNCGTVTVTFIDDVFSTCGRALWAGTCDVITEVCPSPFPPTTPNAFTRRSSATLRNT
jgi:hypothetical protein